MGQETIKGRLATPDESPDAYREITRTDFGSDKAGLDVVEGDVGVTSTVNSTSSVLDVAEVFTGTSEDVSAYASIAVNVYSDVVSAVNGLSCQFSSDGTNWDYALAYSVLADDPQVHTFAVTHQYFRIVYTNGDVAQTAFRLQVIYHKSKPRQQEGGVEVSVRRNKDAPLTRVVNSNESDRNFGRINFERNVQVKGYNDAVGTTEEDIHPTGGTYSFPEAAETVRVKTGGNAADDVAGAGARKVRVKGLDGSFNEITEDIDTAGASASSATTNTFRRVNEFYVVDSGTYGAANTGDIVLENTTSNDVLATIPAGEGRALNAIYTVPANKEGWIAEMEAHAGPVNAAQVKLYKRPDANVAASAPFGAKELILKTPPFVGEYRKSFQSYHNLPEKTDVWLAGVGNTGATKVSANLDVIVVDRDPALIFGNTKSIDFDGNNDIMIGNAASKAYAPNDITISCWIKPSSISVSTYWVAKTDVIGTEQSFYFRHRPGGEMEALFRRTNVNGQGSYAYTNSAPIQAGVWQHVACTFQGGGVIQLYHNGALQSKVQAWNDPPSTVRLVDEEITIGAAQYSFTYYTGGIDEVALFDAVLTADEINEIYNKGVPTNLSDHSQSANLSHWWRMGDGDTYPTILDRVGDFDMTMTDMSESDIVEDAP